MKKRVCCLYRVSTLKQTEKDDIPMQKQVCREFAEHQGWEIVEEKMEKGVSGFKVSAKDRDAILEIQEAALNKQFDILLVFMFDRLGRKEDETPFIVEWFVQNGIEVWSTQEGQQRFENHVDKLMNYIRFWQASGESIKTSIRTKTRLGQIVKEGRFKGGKAPYGYRLVKKGRVGKKSKELYDIEIDELESALVRKIFDLAVNKGYGGRRIASTLLEEGVRNRNGKPFLQSTLNGMLDNIMYLGILRSGESQSEIFPELQIIDQETFDKAQELRNARKNTDQEVKDTKAATPTHGSGLLSGIVYCGHCGHKLSTRSRREKSRLPADDPNNATIPIYMCNKKYYENKGSFICRDGQSIYRANKVDAIVNEMVRDIIMKIKSGSQDDFISIKYQDEIDYLKNGLKYSKELYEQKKKESDTVKSNVVSMLMENKDTSIMMEILNELKDSMVQIEKDIMKFETRLSEVSAVKDGLKKQYNQIIDWAEVYDSADNETKKMIVASIISKVSLHKGYEVGIELQIDKMQYENGLTFNSNH